MLIALLTCLVLSMASAAPPISNNTMAVVEFFAVTSVFNDTSLNDTSFTDEDHHNFFLDVVWHILSSTLDNLSLLTKSPNRSITYSLDAEPNENIPDEVDVKWRFIGDNETSATENSKNIEVEVTALMPAQTIIREKNIETVERKELNGTTAKNVSGKETEKTVKAINTVPVILEEPKSLLPVINDTLETEIQKSASKISKPAKRQLNKESKINVDAKTEGTKPLVLPANEETKTDTSGTSLPAKQPNVEEPKMETTGNDKLVPESKAKYETMNSGFVEPVKQLTGEEIKKEASETAELDQESKTKEPKKEITSKIVQQWQGDAPKKETPITGIAVPLKQLKIEEPKKETHIMQTDEPLKPLESQATKKETHITTIVEPVKKSNDEKLKTKTFKSEYPKALKLDSNTRELKFDTKIGVTSETQKPIGGNNFETEQKTEIPTIGTKSEEHNKGTVPKSVTETSINKMKRASITETLKSEKEPEISNISKEDMDTTEFTEPEKLLKPENKVVRTKKARFTKNPDNIKIKGLKSKSEHKKLHESEVEMRNGFGPTASIQGNARNKVQELEKVTAELKTKVNLGTPEIEEPVKYHGPEKRETFRYYKDDSSAFKYKTNKGRYEKSYDEYGYSDDY